MSMSNLSPAPGTPQTPTKAYVATALAFLVVVAGLWINDDGGTTSKEIVSWIISGLIACGLTGGATYAVSNKPKAAL